MVVVKIKEKNSLQEIKATKEPPSIFLEALSTTIFQNEEYYVYKFGSIELIRRKIGSWVNVSNLLPLIEDASIPELKKELATLLQRHVINSSANNALAFNGTWAPLKTARTFAETHGILRKVAPILSFERLAKVKYAGVQFYEMFVHVNVDVNIRVLREVDSGRINMDQVFSIYNKVRGSQAKSTLNRSLYYHHKDVKVRGDSSLCGGHWIQSKDVAKFSRKHGILQYLEGITGFKTHPDESKPYPLDVHERYVRLFWVATLCDADFYGFPKNFSGGLAPRAPPKKNGRQRTEFAYDELVVKTRINVELTKSNEGENHMVFLTRRLSDGWVNCSVLVQVCVMIRLTELNLSSDDPDLRIENELYFRDVLERYPYEVVVSPKTKTINGKWCAVTNATHIFNIFRIRNTKWGKAIDKLLTSDNFDELDFGPESGNDEDDEELELIDENDFRELQHRTKKKDIFFDEKFFEDGESSAEEALELHGILGDDESDTDTIQIGLTQKKQPVAKRRFVISHSNASDFGENHEDVEPTEASTAPSRKKSRNEDDAEFIEVSTADALERQSSIDSLFEAPSSRKDFAEYLPVEELIKKLKSICSSIDKLLEDTRKVLSKRVQKLLGAHLRRLKYLNGVTLDMKVKSKLNNTLHRLRALNISRKDIEFLESRWVYESTMCPPSLTPSSHDPRPWPPPTDYNAKSTQQATQNPKQSPTQSHEQSHAQSHTQPQAYQDAGTSPYQWRYRSHHRQQYPNGYLSPQQQQHKQQQRYALQVSIPHLPAGVFRGPQVYQQYNNMQQRLPEMSFCGTGFIQREPQQGQPRGQYLPGPSNGHPPGRYSQYPHPQSMQGQYQRHDNDPRPNNFPDHSRNGGSPPHMGSVPNVVLAGPEFNYNVDHNGQGITTQGPMTYDDPQFRQNGYQRPAGSSYWDPRERDFNRSRQYPANGSFKRVFPTHPRKCSDDADILPSRGRERLAPPKNASQLTPTVAATVPPAEKPVAPPSNYCVLNGEPPDDASFGLKDHLRRQAEEKRSSQENELFAGEEMGKFKRAAQFEIGTHEDLLWRHRILFDDNDDVPMVKRISCMISEKNKR